MHRLYRIHILLHVSRLDSKTHWWGSFLSLHRLPGCLCFWNSNGKTLCIPWKIQLKLNCIANEHRIPYSICEWATTRNSSRFSVDVNMKKKKGKLLSWDLFLITWAIELLENITHQHRQERGLRERERNQQGDLYKRSGGDKGYKSIGKKT